MFLNKNKRKNPQKSEKSQGQKEYLGFTFFKVKFKGKRNMVTKSHWCYLTNSIDASQKQVIPKGFQLFPWIFTIKPQLVNIPPPILFIPQSNFGWVSPLLLDHSKSTFKLKIDELLTLILARAHRLFPTKYYNNFTVTTKVIRFFMLQWLWR